MERGEWEELNKKETWEWEDLDTSALLKQNISGGLTNAQLEELKRREEEEQKNLLDRAWQELEKRELGELKEKSSEGWKKNGLWNARSHKNEMR